MDINLTIEEFRKIISEEFTSKGVIPPNLGVIDGQIKDNEKIEEKFFIHNDTSPSNMFFDKDSKPAMLLDFLTQVYEKRKGSNAS